MNRKAFFIAVAVLAVALTPFRTVAQQDACPGWNNPINFTTGNSWYSYTGQGGDVVPYPSTGGSVAQINYPHWSTSSSDMFSASQLNQGVTTGSCGGTGLYNHGNAFTIVDSIYNGSKFDPNTGNHLRLVPNEFDYIDTTGVIGSTQLKRSIRIGDDCAANGNNAASKLTYQMKLTTQNAMLFIYYAAVVQAPGHGTEIDPSFRITVLRKHEDDTWQTVDEVDPEYDYLISSSPQTGCSPGHNNPNFVLQTNFQDKGWHQVGSGYGAIYYKDWEKVAINLSSLVGEDVKIEVCIGDCGYHAHYAYAYICGECRPMRLQSSGCPAGRSTTVGTIYAPRGMETYEWSASRFGVSEPVTDLGPGGDNSHFSFRTLVSGEGEEFADYEAQASDFRVYMRNLPGHDSVAAPYDSMANVQTFRCRMTSRLNPDYPITTSLYVNLQNIKPTMAIDTLSLCSGDISLRNISYVPGDNSGLVVDSLTRWSFYSTPNAAAGTLDTVLIGDTAMLHVDHNDLMGLVVRTFTTDSNCWSEAQYQVRARQNPRTGMAISKYVLCDADSTTLVDTTTGSVKRWWTFLNANSELTDENPVYDTVWGNGATENNIYRRPFSHAVEPITLTVRNGSYYRNPVNLADTVWCQATAYDTVRVFVHPELVVTGDTIVCQGSQTDAYVSAVGVDSCTYEWSTSYGTITGGIPAGDHLAVVPYANHAVYYVRVTSPQGCVAWDSINAYMVVPQLSISPSDGRICPGDVATLTASAAHHYTWTASPADPSLAGQDSLDVIHVSPTQTTVYTMTGHGSNDCDATPLTKTVTIVPLAIPTIHTSPNFVDTDDPTVTISDVSPNGVSSSWLFSDGSTVNAREVTHTFEEATGADSVYVVLTSYNELNCPIEHTFGIPVSLFTAWVPNIFTPGSEDENSKFRIYTINEFENFHIYIYNRQGALVYDSDDPHFEWDGTYNNGEKCPQGAYMYVCNYRKPGTPTLISKHGSVTLVR